MGLYSPNLSLELCPPSVPPQTLSDVLPHISIFTKEKSDDELSRFNDYMNGLLEELRKIEAFSREFPLSIRLLNDVVNYLKEETRKCRETKSRRKMEKLSPSKGDSNGNGGVESGTDQNDKITWMNSRQLWSSNLTKHGSFLQLKPKNEEDDRMASDCLYQQCKYNEKEGTFASFKENSGVPAVTECAENKKLISPTIPCLKIPVPVPSSRKGSGRYGCRPALLRDQFRWQNNLTNSPFPTAKKERRCWSPKLHRRFLDALEKLGGSQVATPKQIRELMQVDGLTSDEVKSHLQKYRLHIRKLLASPPTSSNGMSLDQFLQLDSNLKEEFPQPNSPEGPLQLAIRSTNCNSSCANSTEEDQKSDSNNSWKIHHRRSTLYIQ
ncbi:hypothetical protein Nepgr_016607 [Nepenthes gracilis]|uniref:HTH myb-type domain-containing protein n=1 Tax=Nepenthes gracilis TaxID=150966 RepID=A0AAD3SQV5_NEPGR|nr:hypothetical protein Nepgr_016607 [Nepenthes gracilis]